MKKNTLIISALLISSSCFAQQPDTVKRDTLWHTGGIVGVNFGQASFTNWAAGGENSLSIGAIFSAFANYKHKNITWDNTLDLGYGMIQSGSAPLRKNEDKIDIATKLGQRINHSDWYSAELVNFKSQFADGYNYPNDSVVISHFMAPGYLLGAWGMDYKSQDKTISLFISPLTYKMTFVNDQRLANAGAYGVKPAIYDTVNGVYGIRENGDMLLTEFGAYIKFTFKKDIFKNVNFATKLELFSNYLKNPQDIVVNWENILGLKVNKYLTTTISTVMIYDEKVPVPVKRVENGVTVYGTGPRVQFKEVLAVGLSVKF